VNGNGVRTPTPYPGLHPSARRAGASISIPRHRVRKGLGERSTECPYQPSLCLRLVSRVGQPGQHVWSKWNIFENPPVARHRPPAVDVDPLRHRPAIRAVDARSNRARQQLSASRRSRRFPCSRCWQPRS
jgi:hypothetical protein